MIRYKRWLAALMTTCVLFSGANISVYGAPTEDAQPNVVWEDRQDRTFETGREQTYVIPVAKAGSYELTVEYRTVTVYNITSQASVTLTGPTAIAEKKIVNFSGVWAFEDGSVKNGRFEHDRQGNELMPSYRQLGVWQEKVLPLTEGSVSLEAGEYQLSINMQRGTVQVRAVVLRYTAKAKSYKEYKATYDSQGAVNATGSIVKQEAEMLEQKSDLEIAVSYDRTSPAISPNDPKQMRYNLLGGAQYGTEGQWVSWTVNVPQSGYYDLDFIYRQNINDGLDVRRRLLIDGEVAFAECDIVRFSYTDSFKTKTLLDGDGNPYKFYLKEGKHTIRMEVVLTGMQDILDELNTVIKKLNLLYNKIMVLVGETPDSYRDYDLDTNIKGLSSTLNDCASKINSIVEQMNEEGGSKTAYLSEAARTLISMNNEPRKIPQRLENLRVQINTLSDLMGTIRNQPLELDYFVLRPPQKAVIEPKASFWELVKYRITGFFSTFFQDYNTVSGEINGKPLNVWVSTNDLAAAGYATGRDQAEIVSRLASDGFTSKTNISVRISLLDTSTLVTALVSGKGPDVALFVPKETIANLYYRNALADLTKMPDYSKIEERFYPSALISLRVGSRVYALPEVQSYNMMYYRSDIFTENKLNPPDTWKEFYTVLNRLEKNGMQVGVPDSTLIFEMFLLQNGGSLFNMDVSKTRLTEIASVRAFTEWTDLYTKYGLPMAYDALNRFRTGQMPILLAPASFYGQLLVGAPEIHGQWKMAPIPATVTADVKNRQEPCSVSGAIVLEKSNRHDDGFRFLDWWTSDSTQEKFAFQSESKVGISARYLSANKAAFKTIAWTSEENAMLQQQWGQVNDNPQSPATYFVTRNLINSFRDVIYNMGNPRDVIYRYGQMIDDELTRKREELGIYSTYK